jgi:hypothetical protein
MGLRELHKRRFVEAPFEMAFRTNSNSSNWCFNRFRLYTADNTVMVQARKLDGTIIDTQPFRAANYGWGGDYEASFLFDFSFNTTNEEIEIYIQGLKPGMEFLQLYAYTGHAGSAVRWYEDANITEGITNAKLTYMNMGLLKFDQDYPSSSRGVAFVYVENNGISEITQPDQFYGGIFDIRNCNISASEADQLIIGCDNQGRSGGTLLLSGNNGRTSASDSAWINLNTKSWSLDI